MPSPIRALLCTFAASFACTSRVDPPPDAAPQIAPATPVPTAPAPAPTPTKLQHQQRPATIAVAFDHVCALVGAGEVACWGRGRDGQLAPKIDAHSATPVKVPEITDAVAVAALDRLSCALRADDSLTCWGALGRGATQRTMTARGLGGVAELVLVDDREPGMCARRRDGTVACASLVDLLAGPPAAVADISDAIAVEVEGDRVYVLRATGAVDSFAPLDHAARARALKRERGPGEVTDIGRSQRAICLALTRGEVRCKDMFHGWNSEVPTAGPLWKASVPAEQWAATTDASSVGNLHCTRALDGRVRCRGTNEFGQRGTGTPAHTTAPRRIFEQAATTIDAGADRVCAALTDGETRCFDQTSARPRGPGELAGEAPPSLPDGLAVAGRYACGLDGGAPRCWGDSEAGATGSPGDDLGSRLAGLTEFTRIAVGDEHTCAARSDDSVHCWGRGEHGQLGDGRFIGPDEHARADGEPPSHERPEPAPVAGLEGAVVDLALTTTASCASTRAGLWCWGGLPDPPAPREAIVPRPRLVLAGPLRDVDGESRSLCALDHAGAPHCWGPVAARYRGGVDVKSPDDYDIEHPPPDFVAGGPLWPLARPPVDATAIAVGDEHACLALETGAVSCWGSNEYGQLGDGTTHDRATPVAVRGLPAPVVQLVAGAQMTCARTDDGAVHCWGRRMAAPEHGHSDDAGQVVALAPYVPRP